MNNVMEYKGYLGTVEYSAADNILFGSAVGLGSLISYEGDSLETLRADFEGAVDDYLALCAENGSEPEKTYKGSLNIRISPELHKQLAEFSASRQMSLNNAVEAAIKNFIR